MSAIADLGVWKVPVSPAENLPYRRLFPEVLKENSNGLVLHGVPVQRALVLLVVHPEAAVVARPRRHHPDRNYVAVYSEPLGPDGPARQSTLNDRDPGQIRGDRPRLASGSG